MAVVALFLFDLVALATVDDGGSVSQVATGDVSTTTTSADEEPDDSTTTTTAAALPTSTTAAVPKATTTTVRPVGRVEGRGVYVAGADGAGIVKVATASSGGVGAPSWSPDGTQVAFTRDSGLWVVRVDGSGLRRLDAGGPVCCDARWSPDGARVAVQAPAANGRYRILAVPVGGGPVATLADQAAKPRWSPDGKLLAFLRTHDNHDDLVVRDAAGVERAVAHGAKGEMAWAPDSGRIAYTNFVLNSYAASNGINVVAADGSGDRRLTDTAEVGWPVDWSRQGLVTWCDNGNTSVIGANGANKRVVATGAVAPAFSPTGRMAIIDQRRHDATGRIDTDIEVVESDGSGRRRLVDSPSRTTLAGVSWSPGGDRLAFVAA